MNEREPPPDPGSPEQVGAPLPDRRRFVQAVVAGGVLWTAGGLAAPKGRGSESAKSRRILVDYDKCTGCRTCETVCAQNAAKKNVDGEALWGLGNPTRARIRVYHFNPDADVPVTCVMCDDAPCVAACPVSPDPLGRRALYRDPATRTIRSDTNRCVACGKCEAACREKRVGAIIANPESGKPEGICTLCDGDPQCVKHCPYGALTCQADPSDGKPAVASPQAIARRLAARWYGSSEAKGDALQ